jgi:hypothetical protein
VSDGRARHPGGPCARRPLRKFREDSGSSFEHRSVHDTAAGHRFGRTWAGQTMRRSPVPRQPVPKSKRCRCWSIPVKSIDRTTAELSSRLHAVRGIGVTGGEHGNGG